MINAQEIINNVEVEVITKNKIAAAIYDSSILKSTFKVCLDEKVNSVVMQLSEQYGQYQLNLVLKQDEVLVLAYALVATIKNAENENNHDRNLVNGESLLFLQGNKG